MSAIQVLYEELKRAIHEATRSQYTVHELDAIFSKPIVRSSVLTQQLSCESGIHEKTTRGLLRQMRDGGILRAWQPGSDWRPGTLCFACLINLAAGRRWFEMPAASAISPLLESETGIALSKSACGVFVLRKTRRN